MTGGVLVRRLTPLDRGEIQTAAEWLSHEWGLSLGYSPAETLDLCQSVAGASDQCILIASQNGRMIGTVMVIDNDLETDTILTPWLSALYVAPPHRGRGNGHRLVEAALNFAEQAGASSLYLYVIKGRLVQYYSDLGWRAVDEFTRGGTDFIVMEKTTI